MQVGLGFLLLTATVAGHHCHFHPYKRQFNQPGLGQAPGSDLNNQVPGSGLNNQVPGSDFNQVPGSDFNNQAPNINQQQQPSALPSNNDDDFINNLFPSINVNSNVSQLPAPTNNGNSIDGQQTPTGVNPLPTNNQLGLAPISNEQVSGLNPQPASEIPSNQQSQEQSQEQSIPSTIFDDLPSFLGISFPGQFSPSETVVPQASSDNERSDLVTATPVDQPDESIDSPNHAVSLPISSTWIMAILFTFILSL
ncbi:hypothetical protein LPJ79_003810 [Coemansia sp. RSA 1821]|nr:hypothetical protein LPJ79_003810 [Coemansia sp. RSA 1821]